MALPRSGCYLVSESAGRCGGKEVLFFMLLYVWCSITRAKAD